MFNPNEVTYVGFFEEEILENGFGCVRPSGKTSWFSVPYTENKSTPEEARRAAEEFARGKSIMIARCSWKKVGENEYRQTRTWIEK
nr:MAG TPA: hypothetical protein [Caudoviricetes sp.]